MYKFQFPSYDRLPNFSKKYDKPARKLGKLSLHGIYFFYNNKSRFGHNYARVERIE